MLEKNMKNLMFDHGHCFPLLQLQKNLRIEKELYFTASQHTGGGKWQIKFNFSIGVSHEKCLVVFSAIEHQKGQLIELRKKVFAETLS
jgi:hypothetical protein